MIYLGQVTVDLIPVEISIVRVAVRVVHPDGLVTGVTQNADPVGHDARLVERRLAVDQHAVPVEEVPPNLEKQSRPGHRCAAEGLWSNGRQASHDT